MKKTIIISVIAILIVTFIGVELFNVGRNPGTILRRTVKSEFGIKIKDINPSVTHFEEQWCPNGDGDCLIKFKYDKEDSIFFTQFNRLPIKDDLPIYGEASQYLQLQQGYYRYRQDDRDPRNLSILIVDPQKQNGILYYQAM